LLYAFKRAVIAAPREELERSRKLWNDRFEQWLQRMSPQVEKRDPYAIRTGIMMAGRVSGMNGLDGPRKVESKND
jgi:hypothetical protein